jgi:hypothetical protein
MNVGVATIAAFLLLLPGVIFIVGVNIADKNVREIVFRNTPAELGYVIVTSLAVHLLIAVFSACASAVVDLFLNVEAPGWLKSLGGFLPAFNAASIYLEYVALSANMLIPNSRTVLIFSLSYFLFAAVCGFLPGVVLGRWVRSQRWAWTRFFVKHRWMLDLIQIEDLASVSARVVLKDKFAVGYSKKEHPIILEGVLRDSYFGADGKLLYLVFKTFVVLEPDGARSLYFRGLGTLAQPARRQSGILSDQLVIEGDRIELVRYSRREIPPDQVVELDKKIEELIAQTQPPEIEASSSGRPSVSAAAKHQPIEE